MVLTLIPWLLRPLTLSSTDQRLGSVPPLRSDNLTILACEQSVICLIILLGFVHSQWEACVCWRVLRLLSKRIVVWLTSARERRLELIARLVAVHEGVLLRSVLRVALEWITKVTRLHRLLEPIVLTLVACKRVVILERITWVVGMTRLGWRWLTEISLEWIRASLLKVWTRVRCRVLHELKRDLLFLILVRVHWRILRVEEGRLLADLVHRVVGVCLVHERRLLDWLSRWGEERACFDLIIPLEERVLRYRLSWLYVLLRRREDRAILNRNCLQLLRTGILHALR